MTKKDYILLADTLAEAIEEGHTIEHYVMILSRALKQENDRFDPRKFSDFIAKTVKANAN